MSQPNPPSLTLPVSPLTDSESRTLFAFDVLSCWQDRSRWSFPNDIESQRLNRTRWNETLKELQTTLTLDETFPERDFQKNFLMGGMILRDADKAEAVAKFVTATCKALDALHDELKEAEQMRKNFLEYAKNNLEQFQWCEGVNGFVSFYHSVQEEYSTAEGGCWFIRRTPVACYPAKNFWNYETKDLDQKLLEAEACRLGLTLEGEEVPRGDGTFRKVRPICSCASEADGEAFLETYPFSHAETIAPRYEWAEREPSIKPTRKVGFFVPVFLLCFFRLRRASPFRIVPLLMKNAPSHTSPSTLTRQAQSAILRKHLNAFVKAQAKATAHLQAINEIALCENEGNPLSSALQGTHSVVGFAGCHDPMEVGLNDTLENARQALDASGFWASA